MGFYFEEGYEVDAKGRSASHWTYAYGARFRLHPCDLAGPVAPQAISGAAQTPVDTLICSAAELGCGAYLQEQFDCNAFVRTLAIKWIAPAILARELKPCLEASSRRYILIMSTGKASLGGKTTGQLLAYRTSKWALNQFMRSTATELERARFLHIGLEPGMCSSGNGR